MSRKNKVELSEIQTNFEQIGGEKVTQYKEQQIVLILKDRVVCATKAIVDTRGRGNKKF